MAWSRSQPKSLCRCHLDNLSGRTAIFTEPTPAPPHETGPWLLSPAGCRRTGKPTPDPPPSGLPDLAFDADWTRREFPKLSLYAGSGTHGTSVLFG